MSNLHSTDGKLRCSAVLAVVASNLLICTGWAAESNPASNATPRVASAPSTNAPSSFRINQGFRLELVAAEPVVTAPVAMAFDEKGRLFVVERGGDADRSGGNPPRGRIRLLEDTEGEGEFHTSTVYADNLPLPSAVACYSGGVFVAAGPEIIYLKDSKTNGIADVTNTVFRGFSGTNTVNAIALPNNFNWGLDNRIHSASAGGVGLVPVSSAPDSRLVSLSGADFCFDPRTLTIAAEAGPGQSGLTFDDRGRKFVCGYAHPLRSPTYEPRYLARNPFFPAPPLMHDAASPATPIFRLLSVGVQAAPQVTNLLVATWLTNAQGCVVYRGNAFPSNYLGSVFIADPSAHIIHRAVLREAGLDVTAVRPTDGTTTEFVASPEAGFRPVQMINGPDGALYIADRQDADDRGRIYRVVPADFKRPQPPRLGQAKTPDLVATLSHPNGWQRDTAARLLYERRDPKAAPLLTSLLANSRVPLARLHALHALDGVGALNQAHVLRGLRDADERVREHAVLLSEKLVQGGAFPDALWNQLRLMATDPSLRVRYQLAFTIGETRRRDNAQVLAAVLLRSPTNLWMQAAVFSSLAEGAGDLFVALAGDTRIRRDPLGQEWLHRLAAMIGVKGLAEEVAQILGFMNQLGSEPQQAFALLYALGDGLHRTRSSLALVDAEARLQTFYAQAMNALLNPYVAEPLRVGGMQLLGVGPYTFADAGDLLLLELGSGRSEAIQSTALATLGRFDDPRIAPALIQRWRVLTPRLRSDAFTALLARTDRVTAVLAALENRTVSSADLSSAQVNFLRTHRDPAVSERALRLFGPVTGKRLEAVQRFRPALGLKGAAARGRDIFLARCAVCHQRGGATPAMGPDLADVRIYPRDRVLTAILEPNAEVRPDYLTYVVETAAGEPLVGLLRDEYPATITLQRTKGGPVVLPRHNVPYLQAQPWSLMPERLEEGLTAQTMADLLEYVVGAVP
jgi:putative membrane-bound dehydrogenase-like protein